MLNTSSAKKIAKSFSNFIYKNFETGSGKMILLTTMIAMGLSTAAQTVAVLINKKYSVSQKAFMIPQEITEGIMTIASLFLISKPLQMLSKKMTKTGKIITSDLKAYLEKQKLSDKCGKYEFDIEQSINNIINNLQKDSKFHNISEARKDQSLNIHREMLQNYYVNSDVVSAIATTAGSILTTALISPFIRNLSASHYQQVNLNIYENIANKKHAYNNKYCSPNIYYKPDLKI